MNIDQENFQGIDGVNHFDALSKQDESYVEKLFLMFVTLLFLFSKSTYSIRVFQREKST